jgi:predicted short-subunit dehydrogenase-like oxidoreductase (DUF2520 family)
LKSISKIRSISIIGSGNVATTLVYNFRDTGLIINDIYSRNEGKATILAKTTNTKHITGLQSINLRSDLYIIAVNDDSIENIVADFPEVDGIVVHTSGSKPMSLLKRFDRYGIFYPLQTITSTTPIKLKEVPICIEAESEETIESIDELASQVSSNVFRLDSEKRLFLHMTAVMVNNFSNYMYSMAHHILENKDIDFNLLLPLINETAQKINDLSPHNSQTGPARRKDVNTIEKHLKLLSEFPEYKEVYELLTKNIIKKYHE